jgi:hypothetical protein
LTAFNVWVAGQRKIVYVDDFLPYRSLTSTSHYFASRASDLGVWVPLLEKAWAKVNGNFDRIVAGNEMEAFYFLTGFPAQNYGINASFAFNGTAIFQFVKS